MMEKKGYGIRDIQTTAVHANVATTEIYLDQHRSELSKVALELPQRPKT